MGLVILLLIIGLPLVEIYLFIEVGGEIGALSTVILTVMTAVIGMALVRTQGMGVIQRARASVDRGETPLQEALDGVALLLAGVFLFIPGFFTDALGALLLIPLVREAIAMALLSKVLVARANSTGSGNRETGNRRGWPRGGSNNTADNTVDGEFEDITPGETPSDIRQIDRD